MLRSATLTSLVPSIHELAHSLRSLPLGTVEILESVFTLKSRLKETSAFVVVTRNTPVVDKAFLGRTRVSGDKVVVGEAPVGKAGI